MQALIVALLITGAASARGLRAGWTGLQPSAAWGAHPVSLGASARHDGACEEAVVPNGNEGWLAP